MYYIATAATLMVGSILIPLFMLWRCNQGKAGGPEDHPKTIYTACAMLGSGVALGLYAILANKI